jgi:hypothetical protein
MAIDEAVYNNASATPEPYRFTLLNTESNQMIVLSPDSPPLEWKSGVVQIERDIKIGGVFTSFQVDTLTFINEGAKFLRDIWNEKEFNGKCDLIIERLKYPQNLYVEMPTRFSLDFAKPKPYVEVGGQSIGFQINAVKDDILVKLENRRDKNVDISKRYQRGGETYIRTIGEAELLPYTDPKILLQFPETNVDFVTRWIGDYSSQGRIDNDKDRHIYTSFDMKFNANDIADTVEIDYGTNKTSVSQIPACFTNSENDARSITFDWIIFIEVTNRKGGVLSPSNVYATFLDIYNGSTLVSQERIGDVGKNKGTFTLVDTRSITIQPGESIKIYIRTDDTDGIDAYIRKSDIRIIENAVTFEARDTESIPLYKGFERILQHVLDVQFPFYSDFFGTVDDIYNLNGDKYLSENQLRHANLMSGLNLRGAKLFDNNNPLTTSFDDLFDSGNALYNIGYETEIRDGFERIRIENYDYFFPDIEALDLSDRLTRYDIETEAMPELAYSEIKTGYEDYTYESINGRGEYNTESTRTTLINTNAKFENKSKIRGDTQAISEKLGQPLTNEDTDEDNQLFIIKTQRDGDAWKPEKQENITIENNSSLYGEDSLNLYYTPTRNLLRHAWKLKAPLMKFKSSFLSFQKSNKKQDLTTTGEGYTITENDNIQVDSLSDPKFRPIRHTVTTKFTWGDFDTFMQNPKGYITLSSEIKIYVLSLKKENGEDRATIEGIEKYN